jgi:DNA-binding response OmpR family regulator
MRIQSNDLHAQVRQNPAIERLALELLNHLLAERSSGRDAGTNGLSLVTDRTDAVMGRLVSNLSAFTLAANSQSNGIDENDGRIFAFGNVRVDPRLRTVTRSGRPVKLTFMEFELLVALARRHGVPVTKYFLRHEVWKDSIAENSRTIDQHVHELRHKLEEDPHSPLYLKTIVKVGYSLKGDWVAVD